MTRSKAVIVVTVLAVVFAGIAAWSIFSYFTIARAHGAAVSQVALSWEVSFHGETVVAIPGASRPTQAEQAAAAADLVLSPREMARIDELSRPG